MASIKQRTIQTVPSPSGERGRNNGINGAASSKTSQRSKSYYRLTLATNASQQDIIVNQLGNSVNLVTEPERRDTFPAIALVAYYLKIAKQCSNEEVVIMPCNPYTKLFFFKTIGKIVEYVKQNVADLVIMGIELTYPSEKYGYVVSTSLGSDGFGNHGKRMEELYLPR